MLQKAPVSALPKVHASECLLPDHEAARFLGVTSHWLARDRWAGPTVPFVRIGRSVRYQREDLLAYIQRHKRGAQS